jgi:cytochrome P450
MPDDITRLPHPMIPTLSVQALEADPHGVFRHYRPLTPVIAREGGGFIVLRAADVEGLIRDSRVRQAETEMLEQRGVADGALFDLFRFGMVTSNGAAHRRRRAPFTRTFAAAMIAALRPAIRQGAEALIGEWRDRHEVDLVDQYAALIPARTISTMLGLPDEDIPTFTKLVYSVSRFLSFTFAPEELDGIRDDARALYSYVEALLANRRQAPGSDVLSTFLADAAAKDELSAVEVVVQVVILIIGGTDTTRVAMASQVSLLLQHRAQWDAVREDPSLARQAVAEALRFEPSVGSVGRVALEDIVLDDTLIPAGQFLTLSTMSAMRDDAAQARPDVFDIHRTDGRRLHLVFGGGAHRCLGEALAWAELEEGLCTLAARLPGLRLAGAPPPLRGHMGIRRIGEMPVAW